MDEMVNVYNKNKFNIGIKKPDGTSLNIRPGSFIMLTQNEIDWLNSVCDFIPKGILQLDEAHSYITEKMGINIKESVYAMDDEAIKDHLNMGVKKLEEWLDGINDKMLINRICDIAETMDISRTKMKMLKEKAPERDLLD